MAPKPAGDVDLVHGPLHLMILKILTWGPLHGYAIARSIRQLTGDVLAIEEGSLYPALHRMEDRGWVEAEWGLSDGNRRARFYRLTTDGRDHLGAASPRWLRFAEAVSRVLAARERPAT
jgi:transcriptional regulator